MFGDEFYNSFKEFEREFDVFREGNLIFKSKGIISPKGITMPPSEGGNIKRLDQINDGNNELVVTYIEQAPLNGVWNLKVKNADEYKNSFNPKTKTINLHNGNYSEINGNNNNISNNNEVSITNFREELPKVDIEDSAKLSEFIQLINDLDNTKTVKPGLFKKFDNLLSKYPNISNIVSKLLMQFAINGTIN